MKTIILLFSLSGFIFSLAGYIKYISPVLPTATLGGSNSCSRLCDCGIKGITAGNQADKMCLDEVGKSTKCSSWCAQ